MVDMDCRSKLLATAARLFARKGYNGVSVRELAKAAGVNLSMISYHFGGKEGLYAEVLNQQFATLKRVREIKSMETDPLKKFEIYVRATVARYRKNPYLLRFYTSELTNPTPCFDTIVKPAIKGVMQILLETFSEGLSHEKFRAGLDPTDTVLALALVHHLEARADRVPGLNDALEHVDGPVEIGLINVTYIHHGLAGVRQRVERGAQHSHLCHQRPAHQSRLCRLS